MNDYIILIDKLFYVYFVDLSNSNGVMPILNFT